MTKKLETLAVLYIYRYFYKKKIKNNNIERYRNNVEKIFLIIKNDIIYSRKYKYIRNKGHPLLI